MRVSKAPEERRTEILETAMRLFTENGYENTSMRDIAKELNVVQGLCYRYFDSKQKLFQEAMETYVRECCADFIRILQEDGLTFVDKLDALFDSIKNEKIGLRYHAFFHKKGNEEFHEQLSLKLCKYLHPYFLQVLHQEAVRTGRSIRNPELLVDFITFGQISLLSKHEAPREEELNQIKKYIQILLQSQMSEENSEQ